MSDATNSLNAALEGRYLVERELGEGGMATVYLADDVRHGDSRLAAHPCSGRSARTDET